MFKSYARILGPISFSAIFLSMGVASAADVPSPDSIDSRPVGEFVQEQDQARYRHEEQLRGQADGGSDKASEPRGRRQVQSMGQERRQAQTRSQQRLQLPGAGQRGMAMGGSGPGGSRR